MEANELRIGNYYENNGFRQIEPSDIDFCHRNEQSFNKLNKPIPLTEQWLKDFEFKRKMVILCESSVCTSERTLNYKSMGAVSTAFYINNEFIVNIGQVHQLQNLYFALTGKELIFKHNEKT